MRELTRLVSSLTAAGIVVVLLVWAFVHMWNHDAGKRQREEWSAVQKAQYQEFLRRCDGPRPSTDCR